MANRNPTARLLGDGYVGVWVHYDDREHAKQMPGARWDKHLKCWRVPEMFIRDVQTLIDRLNGGGDGHLVEALGAVFRRLPVTLRQPTYTALVKVWHPDAGGDLRAMQSLTAMWQMGVRP
ncbi:MAG: hypothetical protein H0U53_03220 [Actinobacteria bacterium]|nr:hypothetical protein [Actinomycetota bacterium]